MGGPGIDAAGGGFSTVSAFFRIDRTVTKELRACDTWVPRYTAVSLDLARKVY
jgi:hypothetical protein